MDVHVPRSITTGLRLLGVDVITAQEDGAGEIPDAELLDRDNVLQRVMFTFDDDLLTEAARRQRESIPFAGVVFAHQLRIGIGVCISDLGLIARAAEAEEFTNRVEFIPL
jgi:hypothetical protein